MPMPRLTPDDVLAAMSAGEVLSASEIKRRLGLPGSNGVPAVIGHLARLVRAGQVTRILHNPGPVLYRRTA